MAKFHVNDSGEAGPCGAKPGGRGCPFGGEAQHYATPEIARQAFELSMAASEVPATVKKVPEPSIAAENKADVVRPAGMTDAEENFNPSNYGGFSYKEVAFDEEARAAHWQEKAEIQGKRSGRSDVEIEAAAERMLKNDRRDWEASARTAPAKSNEANVPIRLLPVGTEVAVRGRNNAIVGRSVGTPVDNGDGEIVGKYRDSMNEWDYVQPNTTFDLGNVDPGKNVSPRWKAANEKAMLLKVQRAKYTTDKTAGPVSAKVETAAPKDRYAGIEKGEWKSHGGYAPYRVFSDSERNVAKADVSEAYEGMKGKALGPKGDQALDKLYSAINPTSSRGSDLPVDPTALRREVMRASMQIGKSNPDASKRLRDVSSRLGKMIGKP